MTTRQRQEQDQDEQRNVAFATHFGVSFKPMRIAFAGSGYLGANLVRPIMESRHELVALIQNGRGVGGFSRRARPLLNRSLGGNRSIMGIAARNGIPIVWLNRMEPHELAPIAAAEPDLLLVGGFGIILKPPLLNLPRLGCVNTHSSLLPRHRGPNPFTPAILDGDSESGITFHRMDVGIDTGPILAQHRAPIDPRETAGTLHKKLSRLAGEHVLSMLDAVEEHGLDGAPQDPAFATYEKAPKLEDTYIDWAEPAETIDRRIRALHPIHRSRFWWRGRFVYVLRAEYDDTPVEAEPGTVLRVRPRVTIATGKGRLTVRAAYTSFPVPWRWPAPWSAPEKGDVLA
ncbi:MAG: methionyl-tRNA formyltransferase [Candidatus Hydrogenedentota bacterium]